MAREQAMTAAPRRKLRTCWHGRARSDCWLCRLHVDGGAYWELVKLARKRERARR